MSLPHGRRQVIPIALHVSLIGWSSYRTRCGYDQEATISKPGASATVTYSSLSGCSFVTLVLTDTEAQQPALGLTPPSISYDWTSQLVAAGAVLQ